MATHSHPLLLPQLDALAFAFEEKLGGSFR